MPTTANSLFPITPMAHVDLTKAYPVGVSVPTTAGGVADRYDFWLGQRVDLNGGQVAMFVKLGTGGISVSTSCTADANGLNGTTFTISTGGVFISMNATSVEPGGYCWVRTSGLRLIP